MRYILLLVSCMFCLQLSAQRITHNFRNVTMPTALQLLNESSRRYTVNFIYDDLEDFRITADIKNATVPDAIRQMIGFYPITMAFPTDSIIMVECSKKTDYRFKGRIVDENGQPAEFANITLLSLSDSSTIGVGVSNVSGYFVIPCQAKKVIARISYVGYKTIQRVYTNPQMGVIRLSQDRYTLNGVVVKGHKSILHAESDRLQYIVASDAFAKGLNGAELLSRVPLLDGTGEGLPSVIGKSNTHYLLNGRELPANMQLSKIRSLKAEEIERVEVITIPPSKYKAEANAGYVNIVTKRDATLGLRGDILASASHQTKWDKTVSLSLFYATKRLNVSLVSNLWNVEGINDHTSEFIFDDHKRTTDYRNTFKWLVPSSNILAQYKLSDNVNIGVLGSVDTNHSKLQRQGTTTDFGKTTHNRLESPAKPNFNLSAEAYLEWKIDNTGKMMNLTYDYLNNYSKQDETIISENEDSVAGIRTLGNARFHIDSWKLDLMLPYSWAIVETGLAYTSIMNKSGIKTLNKKQNMWQVNPSQTNDFNYQEKTAAMYASMSRNWKKWSAMAGLRLEKTWTEGLLLTLNQRNKNDYLRLFPTLHVNWRMAARSNLRFAYSMGIIRPDFTYLNPFRYYYSSTSYVEGNPYLDPSITNNIEMSYSNDLGLYAVLYENHANRQVGSYTSFSDEGAEMTTIANCLVSDKTGLYVSYQKNLMPWWNMKAGGEVFFYHSHSIGDYKDRLSRSEWSGKIELSQMMFLNPQHTLSMELYYNHIFPHSEMGSHFRTVVYFGGNLRLLLLDNRLKLSMGFTDPFKQNISRGTAHYKNFTNNYFTDAHSRGISLAIAYSFGGRNIRSIYHESKNSDASRAKTSR